MKKALLLAAVLAALSFGTADASRFEMVRDVYIKGAYDGSYYVNFKEGKKTIQFISVSRGANDYTLLATSKPDWLDNYDIYWSYSTKFSKRRDALDYFVRQYRDVDTGRYFYGVIDFRYQEEPTRAFLLGYDAKKKSMITYIDSNKMERPKDCLPSISLHKGNLILWVNDFENP